MQFRKSGETTVMEAVDNLSHMAEVDLYATKATTGLTDEQMGEQMDTLSWYDPTYQAYNQDRIKETFRILHKYMQELYEKDKGQLRDLETQQGIQALMLLAGEAAQKIDNFTEIFKGESVTELKEFKELQHFYLTKVVQRFQMLTEPQEEWHAEWGAGIEEAEGLKDMNAVRRDQYYEFFLIRREDGRPLFTRGLLRHMQLVGQFDALTVDPTVETPFKRVQMIQDRDLHMSAKEILHLATPYIDDFYKDALKHKGKDFVAAINKSLMALMLAANSRNLMQNTTSKTSLAYYTDFHNYLRKALSSKEYRNYIASPPSSDERFLNALMNLSHILSASFFLRIGFRKDMVAFIRMLIEKGSKGSVNESQTSSPLTFWNNLIDEDHSLRYFLKQYPSGPLTKGLALFNEGKQLSGFDPMHQQNLPMQLYALASDEAHISCLRLPAPVIQPFINKVEVAEEFFGFLHSLSWHGKTQRHLLINLEDRTSSQEHARCVALEEIPKHSPNKNALAVVTIPKNGDFYMQMGDYLDLNDAKDFMHQFEEQIKSVEQCGFYFPPEMNLKETFLFAREAMQTIHTLFFAGNAFLTHKNRLDFIEIFYLFFSLKLIELFRPDSMSFTCKDAVDTGPAASAELFAFMRLMNDPTEWSKEEKNFFLWMLYAPALTSRERAIDPSRFNRMVNALAIINAEIEAHYSQTVAACGKLFELPFFKGFKVKEAE